MLQFLPESLIGSSYHAVAERISYERGGKIGGDIGYKVIHSFNQLVSVKKFLLDICRHSRI